ncbi:MAG: DUF2799 domain-containing protein [Pseudobdellovibrionaceae bacterium]|nr:DUF2799 domain-containing protein [Bdellovibrionales bacterium]USN48715.1 MAG: DUF2799 domain-containing protein [Pseudobdellovibrionaceae bacterium]
MLKSIVFSVLLTGFGFMVSSCSSISKEECQVGDWTGIGHRDGSQGREQKRFYSYVEDCGEHGVTPNHDQYKQGYEEGLKVFCTPDNGWSVGRSGRSYNNICPPHLAKEFMSQYRKGQKVHQLEVKIRNLQQDINATDNEISVQEKALLNKTNTGADVLLIGAQIDKLRRKKLDQEKEIFKLQQEMQRVEQGG